MLHCQLCYSCYTALQIKNCSKSTPAIHAYCIKRKKLAIPSYISYCLKSIHYASLSAMFNPLHSNTNQGLFEKYLCNQSNHYEKYGYERKPSCATAKSTLFTVSKDEWDTKEDTGKSMKNALYVLRYAKRHYWDRSNVKQ